MEQLRQITTKEDLEMSKQNMQNYIGGPVQIRTMLLLLERDVKIGSKSLYPDIMEARVCFQPDFITQFGDVIAQYLAWHQYVTEKDQVEVVELEFPSSIMHHSVLSCYAVKLSLPYFVLYAYKCKL